MVVCHVDLFVDPLSYFSFQQVHHKNIKILNVSLNKTFPSSIPSTVW